MDQETKKIIFWIIVTLSVLVILLHAGNQPPAHTPTFQERQQAAKEKANREWRESVCKDLGC